MAKKKPEEEQCGNWMDTYGDMVTLLLTFFVLLYSMADLNEQKYSIFARAFTSMKPDVANIIFDQTGLNDDMAYPMNRTNREPNTILANSTLEELQEMIPGTFDELYEYLVAYVQKSGMEGSVEVLRKGDGCVFIRFQDNIFFTPDSSRLRETSRPLLDFLGNALKNLEEKILTININGHTADPKIENYGVSDWRLSSERAANVAVFFEEEKDITPNKLLPIGYGKNFPVSDNETPEGRERNRRVDMLIISNESELTADEILTSIFAGGSELHEPAVGTAGIRDILVPNPSEKGDQNRETSAQPNAAQSAGIP